MALELCLQFELGDFETALKNEVSDILWRRSIVKLAPVASLGSRAEPCSSPDRDNPAQPLSPGRFLFGTPIRLKN
jgi:hypothetical protein